MSNKNHKKDNFLSSIPTASLDSETDLFAEKCKFNFSYMDFSQDAGQNFQDWTKEQICKLLEKLQNYSKRSLQHWGNTRAGGGGNFVIYDKFPTKSKFVHPKHVPHQARWARFRLEGAVRLVGFVIPDELHDSICKKSNKRFDANTFYVVFLDANHKFYITK